MVVGPGSSQPIDVVDLTSCIALSADPTLSEQATTSAIADLNTPIISRTTDDESGAHTKTPHAYTT